MATPIEHLATPYGPFIAMKPPLENSASPPLYSSNQPPPAESWMCSKMPLKTCKNITLCHVLSEHKQLFLPIAHVIKNGCHNRHDFVGFCSIELRTATMRSHESHAIIAFLENLGPCIGLTLKRRLSRNKK